MTLKEWTVVGLVFLGCVFTFYKACTRNAVRPSTALTLKEDEKLHVRVGPSHIESLERTVDGKETVRKDEPNYHHGTEIVVKEDGSMKVIQKTQGFSKDFGLSITPYTIGMAHELYYYKDLSILAGSQFINLRTKQPWIHFWMGLGYRIPYPMLNNVSVYTGFDTERKVIVGIFLRLGNS